MRAILSAAAASILTATLILSATPADTGYPGPHTCQEDEAQYVQPAGLTCTPLDDLRTP
jgi:hypothetical protein